MVGMLLLYEVNVVVAVDFSVWVSAPPPKCGTNHAGFYSCIMLLGLLRHKKSGPINYVFVFRGL